MTDDGTAMDDGQAELLRARYIADQVATATPAQRLLMLFDRLSRDLRLAEQANRKADLKTTSDSLVHAQEVLFALRDKLDLATTLGTSLHGVYTYCIEQLLRANLTKNLSMVEAVRDMTDRIAAANRRAAAESAAARGTGPAPGAYQGAQVAYAS